MKTAFIGTVEGSLVGLAALIEAGLAPGLVVTLDPAVSHRHSDYVDLRDMAAQAGCQVVLTRNINDAGTLAALRDFAPDLALVIGWSQICKAEFLALPRLGSIGFHPSPLPRFRGRAVIPWTIIAGETRSGSSLFELAAGTDTGAIVAQRLFDLVPAETARSLYDRHTANLAVMLPEAVADIAAHGLRGVPQDETDASLCAKRTPADGRIDWQRPAAEIERLVRAVGDPYPDAFTRQGGRTIAVRAARLVTDGPRFVGLTGQVQTRTSEGWTVLCGDGEAIEVTGWTADDARPPAVHSMLGEFA